MQEILSNAGVAAGIAVALVALLGLIATTIRALQGQVGTIIGMLGDLARQWLQAQIDELHERRRAHIADLAVAAVEQTANGDKGETKLARAKQVARDMGIADITADEIEAALKRAQGWYAALPLRTAEMRLVGETRSSPGRSA